MFERRGKAWRGGAGWVGVAGGRGLRAMAGLVALGMLLSGCTRIENAMASVSWLDFMHSSPAFDPMEATRPAPEHSVPYATATGDPWAPPIEPNERALNAFGDTAVNPVPVDSATLARGKEVFDTFCFVCHGTTGVGNGPAIGQGKLPYAANLMLPITVNRTDGYIYAVIRSGRGLMPNYKRIPTRDRWAVVNYVRELQRQAQADSAGGQ